MRKVLFLTLCIVATTLCFGQEGYTIGDITVINIGDGRLLHRDAKTEQPLNGQQRIIDGYRTEYIEAEFKDGFYDGVYKHFRRNLLVMECTYQEGWLEGERKTYFSDGETLNSVGAFSKDKLHGKYIEYDTDGKVVKDCAYQEGEPHGKHLTYDSSTGDIRSEETYVNGKLEGKQIRNVTGSRNYQEISHYKNGLQEGEYYRENEDGIRTESGAYTKGKKSGPWVKLNIDGDSIEIRSYKDGELDGLFVDFFTTGKRSKAYMYKNGKRNGKCVDYDNRTGNPKKITHYKDNREHGTVQIWVTSTGFDYIETTTWENGKRNGPYEAVYQETSKIKAGTPKERGQYTKGAKSGIWTYYDTEGNLTKEQNHD